MSTTQRSTALVQHYVPEIEKRCRPHLKATNDSWRVDETYIKVKKVRMYLYRAVDSQGKTLEFLLSPARNAVIATWVIRLKIRTSRTIEHSPLLAIEGKRS